MKTKYLFQVVGKNKVIQLKATKWSEVFNEMSTKHPKLEVISITAVGKKL